MRHSPWPHSNMMGLNKLDGNLRGVPTGTLGGVFWAKFSEPKHVGFRWDSTGVSRRFWQTKKKTNLKRFFEKQLLLKYGFCLFFCFVSRIDSIAVFFFAGTNNGCSLKIKKGNSSQGPMFWLIKTSGHLMLPKLLVRRCAECDCCCSFFRNAAITR